MRAVLRIFFFFTLTSNAWSQDLTLSGNAVLFMNADGLPVSTGRLILNGNSRVIGAEGIRLLSSDFIYLKSPEARLFTMEMGSRTSITVPVGIDSKSQLIFRSGDPAISFSIGMDTNEDTDALPYKWNIGPNSDGSEAESTIEFSWEKSIEPSDFELKALVINQDEKWELILDQEVDESKISLLGFSEFDERGGFFTVKNFDRDLDEDEVPDIIEIGETTDLEDPGNYLDSDGDGVPDYLEIKDGTDPDGPEDYLDNEGDGVPDYLGYRSPVGFMDLKDVLIDWGLENYQPLFQDSVLTMLGSGRLVTLPLNWDYSALNVFARGIYPVDSDLELPKGVFNAYELRAEVDGIVLPKPSPLDVDLTNSNFMGDEEIFFIPIGAFIIEDPVDQIHTVALLGSEYDNKYFEIKENILFWSSAARAEGRVTFKILVRVTDRDGNTLDKFFEITRGRASLEEIIIFNTFSPNEDGVNDTWGVPEIRFFRGARVQVFDRGGARVFYTENPDVRWDGTFKGKNLPTGAYTWVMEVIETGEKRMGVLNLIRE
ncbi:gliding motility-associated C-terminal domain-containing protein [Algoriphagus sp.]|uniref:gliding motility-associated C-terminal domain-containing protein n=1 Tax=Algoriphagus sp. TaxID=1872435 RepID=UPI00260405B2|nr:gliding motility-associated C-terminal domain-containing protein [Algoriphagus sp.]